MPRTVISLSDTDKRWLIQKAKAEHVPMTEIIRRALAHYRQQSSEPAELALNELLERTCGLWLKGDELAYQEQLRNEWEQKSR